MNNKRLGFLSFGHWYRGDAGEPDAAAALQDTVQMAVDAEAAGMDDAWFRVHHFQRMISSPFPLLAAMAARTERIRLGTGVIDLRYENPLYFAEAAATADLIAAGRLELGVSRGSPEASRDGQEQFGYVLGEGETWAEEAWARGERIRTALRGTPLAQPDLHSGWSHTTGMLRIEPQSPGLVDRLWWGAGTTPTAVRAAEAGYDLVSSTLLLENDGRPFHVQQADQIARFREAFAAAGHERTPHTAVTRSMLAIQDEQDERMFGHERFSRESSGVLDGKRAVSGPTYAGTPEELAELLAKDEAVQAADLVLVANPSTLGAAYNAKQFAGWMQAWRLLGWAG